MDRPDDIRSVEPFGLPGGGIIAPPVNVPEHGMAIAWDSVNGGLAAVDTTADELTVAWQLDVRPSMQPVVFPESAELVINDFTDDGNDDLIVVDLVSGELIDRVHTGSSGWTTWLIDVAVPQHHRMGSLGGLTRRCPHHGGVGGRVRRSRRG